MKLLSLRNTLARWALPAGIAAVCLLLWKSQPHATEPDAPATPHAVKPDGMAGGPAASASSAPTLPVAEEVGGLDDLEDNALADVLGRVLANDPQLAAFKHYHRRPLLDGSSRARYRELLSDPAVMAGVKHDLLSPEEARADQASEIKRLMKIDYLREALEWKDNPMRPALIALVSELVLTDNFPPEMGMEMRVSLSGNKRELYELLYEVAPDRAQAALRSSKGTRLEPLIAYIDRSLQSRHRLEATAETEVMP